jgi:ribosomal protein S18 acetylase RimI-like enzyme
LDEIHDGGRKLVPNPNPNTRDRNPEVTFNTALKDKAFFRSALKEYQQWAKKNPDEEGASKKPAKGEAKPSKGTPIPDSVPADTLKKVFGDNPPSMEDFQKLFSLGEGYTTKVTEVKKAEGKWDKHALVDGSVEVSVDFHDKDGNLVGHSINNFAEKDGKKIVYFQEIKLDKEHQGGGAGKQLMRSSLEGYQKMGISNLVMDAEWVGRYTWPRMGFEPDKKTLEKEKAKFKKYLVQDSDVDISKEAAEKLVDSIPTMRDLSSVSIDGSKVGKGYLLSDRASSYEARLKLDPNDPGFKVAQEYLQ